jgi:hypothetical protein
MTAADHVAHDRTRLSQPQIRWPNNVRDTGPTTTNREGLSSGLADDAEISFGTEGDMEDPAFVDDEARSSQPGLLHGSVHAKALLVGDWRRRAGDRSVPGGPVRDPHP